MRPKKLPCATALLFLFSSSLLLAQEVSIISPPENRAVTSPIRLYADFPRHTTISSIAVSVDGSEIPQTSAATPLDTELALSEGRHLLTVKALQADGAVVSASHWVTVSEPTAETATVTTISAKNFSSGAATITAGTATSPTVSVSNIEEKSGWYTYPDQGHPTCSATPALVSSPSIDGISGRFYLGPNGQYQNCLWPILLGSNSTISHFQLDAHYRLSNPSYPQGVEFSSNHHVGTKWYKFSVQCSYGKGVFSVWNTAGGHWSPTSIPCKRPAAGTWDHLTVNTEISNGKAVFLSLTLNGVTHTINQSFYPLTESSSYSYGLHFQMDGNLAGNAYYTWVDELKYTAW